MFQDFGLLSTRSLLIYADLRLLTIENLLKKISRQKL